MTHKRRINVSLAVGLAIPVLMIALVAASIYVPALFAPAPRHDFVYSVGDYYHPEYYVEKGALMAHERPEGYVRPHVRFYLYDASSDSDRELDLAEAMKLKLDPRRKSPDGYEVAHADSDGWMFPFFFGGSGERGLYWKGHGMSRRLNLSSADDGTFYDRNRRFVGWVSS